MSTAGLAIDAQRLSLMLNELRLPTIKHIWGDFAAQADKEGWPASRFLAALQNTNWPNVIGGGSSGTWQKLICLRARALIASHSRPCR